MQSGNCGATEARAEETARIKNNNCIRLEMQFQKALVIPVLFLFVEHQEDLVLELQALLLFNFQGLIGNHAVAALKPGDSVIEFIVLFKEFGEVRIASLERMDLVFELGEFGGDIVFEQVHGFLGWRVKIGVDRNEYVPHGPLHQPINARTDATIRAWN